MPLILTRERKARGWSRLELGRRAQLASGDVGQFETGRIVPYAGQLQRICLALGWAEDRAIKLLEEDGTTHDSD